MVLLPGNFADRGLTSLRWRGVVVLGVSTADTAPAFGDDGSNANDLDSIEDQLGESLRVVNNNGTKADVDRRRSFRQEGGQVGGRRIRIGQR